MIVLLFFHDFLYIMEEKLIGNKVHRSEDKEKRGKKKQR